MAYQWDSSLETGYEKVDNQHKQIIEALNSFMEAGAAGKSDDVVLKTMDFLIAYATEHFSDEEELQLWFKYPDYLNHKLRHDEFRNIVRQLVQRVQKEGPTEEVVDVIGSTIGAWLISHIKGDDSRMAAFVKAVVAENRST